MALSRALRRLCGIESEDPGHIWLDWGSMENTSASGSSEYMRQSADSGRLKGVHWRIRSNEKMELTAA